MYLGSDDNISGVFGILTGDGAVGTTLTGTHAHRFKWQRRYRED